MEQTEILRVQHLTKTYASFQLDDVSFSLDAGYILGFIGQNGAGKTTTMKCMFNLVKADCGEVEILGKNLATDELAIRRQVGIMLGERDYYRDKRVKTIAGVYKRFYETWDEARYQTLLKDFRIDSGKRLKELSTGSRIKLSLALELSHGAKLLVFDEPTSGLDPVARRELMDIFRRVVNQGDTSIVFSTHITSDLDKCADYVLFLREGKVVEFGTKDDVVERYCLIAGKSADINDDLKQRAVAIVPNAFGFNALIRRDRMIKADSRLQQAVPCLEDLMLYYSEET